MFDIGLSIVDHGRGQQRQPGVIVLLVVPGEKGPGPGSGIGQGAESLGGIGLILHGLELGLGKGVIIRDMGSRMAGTHAQIAQ